MTWDHIGQRVHLLVKQIPDLPPPIKAETTAEGVRKLVALESNLSKDIDATIRKLARNEDCDVVPPAEQYFLRFRAIYAIRILRVLETPLSGCNDPFLPLPSPADLDSMLEWILIDVWNSANRDVWIGELEDQAR